MYKDQIWIWAKINFMFFWRSSTHYKMSRRYSAKVSSTKLSLCIAKIQRPLSTQQWSALCSQESDQKSADHWDANSHRMFDELIYKHASHRRSKFIISWRHLQNRYKWWYKHVQFWQTKLYDSLSAISCRRARFWEALIMWLVSAFSSTSAIMAAAWPRGSSATLFNMKACMVQSV